MSILLIFTRGLRPWAGVTLTLLGLAACDGQALQEPDARVQVDAGPVVVGSAATAELIINEVAPRGEGGDWIELANRGTTAIDLCDYFLTDLVDRLDHYLPLGGAFQDDGCAALTLAPGTYRTIFADDSRPAAGAPIDPLHAPFKLGLADEVHLVRVDGVVVDGLNFLYYPGPNSDGSLSLARIPDSQGPFYFTAKTQGTANPQVVPQ